MTAIFESNGATAAAYVYDQPAPATVWTIAHNLGAIPAAVSVIDTAGTLVLGDVAHPDANHTVLTFSAPFAGKAYLL